MSEDPFEDFKKKKKADDLPKVAEVDDSFYEIPSESSSGEIKGLFSHRFKDTKDQKIEPGEKPSGFESTKLGEGVKGEKPQVSRPKGFEPTSLTDE